MKSFEVIWSEFAERQLDIIFEYYLEKTNFSIAQKIILDIISAPESLNKNPYSTQREELLKDRLLEYRYLVCRSYKIIFSVDETNSFIKIADIFDTRQNPKKISRKK